MYSIKGGSRMQGKVSVVCEFCIEHLCCGYTCSLHIKTTCKWLCQIYHGPGDKICWTRPSVCQGLYSISEEEHKARQKIAVATAIGFSVIHKWVPVTMACYILRLQIEEQPQIRTAAANILNKQLQTAEKGWSSSLGVGRGANNSSP